MFILLCLPFAGTGAAGSPAPAPGDDPSPFGFCYHLVYSKLDDAALRRQIRTLAASGAKWVRCDLSWPWQRVDKKTGVYSFKNVDRALRLLSEEGLSFLPIVNMARRDARPLHEHTREWCAFITQAVARYRDRVRYWEIWNEQNFTKPDIWGGKDLETHAASYATCLQAAYRAVKTADARAVVLYGGTSLVPIDFIDATFRHGARHAFDVMNVHPYNTSGLPEPVGERLQQLKLLLARHGRPDCPVWVTEIGWSTSPRPETDYYRHVLPRAFDAFGIDPARVTLAVCRSASNPVYDLIGAFPPFGAYDRIGPDDIASLDPATRPILLPTAGEVFPAHAVRALIAYARRGGVVILPKGLPLQTLSRVRDAAGRLRDGPGKINARRELKIDARATWQRAGRPATNISFSVDGPATAAYRIVCNRYLFPTYLAPGDRFVPLAWGVDGDGRWPIAAAYRYADGGGVIALTDVGPAVEPAVSPDRQADFLVRAHLVAFSQGVRRLFWYSYISQGAARQSRVLNANYGVTYAQEPAAPEEKPAYRAYRYLTSLFPAAAPRVKGETLADGVRAFSWRRPDGARVVALWHPDKRVNFRPVRRPAEVRGLFGEPFAAADVLPLGPRPLYLFYPAVSRLTSGKDEVP